MPLTNAEELLQRIYNGDFDDEQPQEEPKPEPPKQKPFDRRWDYVGAFLAANTPQRRSGFREWCSEHPEEVDIVDVFMRQYLKVRKIIDRLGGSPMPMPMDNMQMARMQMARMQMVQMAQMAQMAQMFTNRCGRVQDGKVGKSTTKNISKSAKSPTTAPGRPTI